MSTDPRIEAARAAYWPDGTPWDVSVTELVVSKNRAERMLAAADAVMFSEEAIEQAARRMVAADYGPNWEGRVPEWVLPGYIAKVNVVVAALRGGAEPPSGPPNPPNPPSEFMPRAFG